jgi:predicted nuclease of predicted toxin-antitoxin system
VKFLVDAQLPPALAGWIREAGHEAAHVEDAGLREAEDGPIWEHALQTAAAIITKDEDFAERVARAKRAPEPPVIVWLRIGNTTNPVLRAWFEPRLPGIVELIGQGHRLVEVI